MSNRPTYWSYLGIFLLTLATIIFEIVLTRIFSVTMWYHFAFMAISVALFGLSVGAALVYSLPRVFTQERTRLHLAGASLLFSVFAILALYGHLRIPFTPEATLKGALSVAATYFVLALPFIANGVAVCLALTRFPKDVARLYAADLVGAGLGCLVIIVMLSITDGQGTIFYVAVLGCLAAACFAAEGGHRKLAGASMGVGSLALAVALFATYKSSQYEEWFPIMWVKGNAAVVDDFHHEWSHHAYVQVHGTPDEPITTIGWGISKNWPSSYKIRQANILIDGHAGTLMTHFDGDFEPVRYLKLDLVNIAHYLREKASVLVVGVGGGRDILSALTFGQRHVTGVEINGTIIRLFTKDFAEFTGNIGNRDDVTIVHDEARSYLARHGEKFDILQVSMIDTWASTAAGAFTLTENSLYTLEGWQLMLDRLTDGGILTVSRWFKISKPSESWRVVALACAALRERGIETPQDHILMARTPFAWQWHENPEYEDHSIGTILVSNAPFTAEDIARFRATCEQLQFHEVIVPGVTPPDPNFARILDAPDLVKLSDEFPANISPPTDDSPFFFLTDRLSDVFMAFQHDEDQPWEQPAFKILLLVLAASLTLTLICVLGPLSLTAPPPGSASLPFFLYFSGIGLGFMFVEISQLQRLNLFLGHPTYSLTACLFALLIFSGIGSFLTEGVGPHNLRSSGSIRLGALIALLLVFGFATPALLEAFEAATTPVRILVAVGMLAPLGLFMGMAFPLGIKLTEHRDVVALAPWLWAVNGATSVCASVLSVAIGITLGISYAFWVGVVFYVVTLAAFVWLSRGRDARGE